MKFDEFIKAPTDLPDKPSLQELLPWLKEAWQFHLKRVQNELTRERLQDSVSGFSRTTLGAFGHLQASADDALAEMFGLRDVTLSEWQQTFPAPVESQDAEGYGKWWNFTAKRLLQEVGGIQEIWFEKNQLPDDWHRQMVALLTEGLGAAIMASSFTGFFLGAQEEA